MADLLPARYVGLDLETNDRNPAAAWPCEIAVALVDGGTVLQRFVTFIALPDGMRMDGTEASKVNGITDAMLAGAPTLFDVLPDLVDYLDGDTPIVAYNAPFDRQILHRAIVACGVDLPPLQWVDALPLCRQYLPGLAGYKLPQVGAHLAVLRAEGLHRAMADVDLLVRVCEALRPRLLAPPPVMRPLPVGAGDAPPPPLLPAAPPPPPVQDTAGILSTVRTASAQLAAPTGTDEAIAIALTPLVGTALGEVDVTAKELTGWIALADKAGCDTDADEAGVLDLIKTFEATAKRLVARRHDRVGKVKAKVTEIEKAYRDKLLKPIDDVIARLYKLREPRALARAQAEADRKAAAEAEAERVALQVAADARAHADRLAAQALEAAKAGRAGDAEVMAANAAAVLDAGNDAAQVVYEDVAAEMRAPAAPTVSNLATARDKSVWTVQIVDANAVPRRWCEPSEALLLAEAEATGGSAAIPGVIFTLGVQQNVRARRGA